MTFNLQRTQLEWEMKALDKAGRYGWNTLRCRQSDVSILTGTLSGIA